MPILILAWKSLWNRRATATLTLLSIALSVTLLLGVERLRTETRTSFQQTISGADLVVGARSGSVQLLLYSVFRIGHATNNLSWSSYLEIADHPRVAWAIPLSLGDSHQGFPVLGTTRAYFEHFRFGRGQTLRLQTGEPFSDLYDTVLGSEVARRLGYGVGDLIRIAHGGLDVAFARHDDHPFKVVGILAATGTPVDRTVHVSLEGLEAVHLGWESGTRPSAPGPSPEQARELDLTPTSITAILVGLHSRIATFQVQRFVNEYPKEPLSAILPGVALAELWGVIRVAEQALLGVSVLVVALVLIGLLTTLLTSLGERRREMAILRSVGARPTHIFALILGETTALTLMGIGLGLASVQGLLWLAHPLLRSVLGLSVGVGTLSAHEMMWLALMLGAGMLTGLIPSYRAYRLSLSDGLSIRI